MFILVKEVPVKNKFVSLLSVNRIKWSKTLKQFADELFERV